MEITRLPPRSDWPQLLKRPAIPHETLSEVIEPILRNVRERGDAALLEYARQFDGVELLQITVPESGLESASKHIRQPLASAIRIAHNNIERFHRRQLPEPYEVETMPGVVCRRKPVPIERVGIYIPGGSSPLFSTVLMLGIPARIAGCSEVILCTPPGAGGEVHPAILYAAALTGIRRVFAAGGAQAIAAMAYGTESIPRVHKIFGPGNQYVTAAKQRVSREGVAVDLPAGPSEVCVLADGSAKPQYVAADLLSQAEHGPDSQVMLITDDSCLPGLVEREVKRQLSALPRSEIAAAALEHSRIILIDSMASGLDLVNLYAPEHLILAVQNAHELAEGVRNAGSVFLGHMTPESAGDYASGTNHTLPTNGYAAAVSGVSVESFMKQITFQSISAEGLLTLGPAVIEMAMGEGLDAHARAVQVRLDDLGEDDANHR